MKALKKMGGKPVVNEGDLPCNVSLCGRKRSEPGSVCVNHPDALGSCGVSGQLWGPSPTLTSFYIASICSSWGMDSVLPAPCNIYALQKLHGKFVLQDQLYMDCNVFVHKNKLIFLIRLSVNF